MKRTLLIIGLLPLLTCCSIEQRLAATSADVEDIFAQAKEWEQLPIRTISWNQALSMISNNNIDLKKLKSTIARSEREGLSIYTDMIPGISYYGYMTKSINSLTRAYTSDDVTSNINVTFNLPGLTQIPYRIYAARANTYAAIKAKELREREIMANLYSAVRKRALELKLRDLEKQSPDYSETNDILAKNAQLIADCNYWKDIAATLGDYSARWVILPESLPKVSWNVYSKKLDRLSPLTVCNYALRLERARLSQYSIALRYLPTINTNLYSPSLFSSTGGTYQGTFLDGEDTKLNFNISYTLDTQLDTWNSYKDNKEEFEHTKHEVAAAIMEHKHKLAQLRRSVEDYQSWRSYMQKRMRYVAESPVTTAEELLQRDRSLHDMRKELLSQEQKAIESETAVLIEYGLL